MSGGLLIFCLVLGGCGVLALLIALLRGGRPIRTLLVNAVQGFCALAAVNVVGGLTGVSIGLNVFSLVTCAVMGVPGVVTLLLLNLIL